MSESHSGKDERKKPKKASKSDKKEKPSTDDNLRVVPRSDFPLSSEKVGNWKPQISEATDTGEELPHGLRRPEIQACFVKDGYEAYHDIPPILALQLLLLPSSDEERDRTTKIWDYCTNLPAPRPDRWTQVEEFFEAKAAERPKAGKGDQTKSPVSPADAGKLRSFMDPATTGNRPNLKWGDMHSDGRENTDDYSGEEGHDGKGKSSQSTSSREHARGEPFDRPDTPQWERDGNFRAAIRAA